MNTLKSILWISCLFLALSGCKEKQSVTISFDIRDYDGTIPRIIMGYLNQNVEIDSLGKGSVTLDLADPAYAQIQVRKHDKKEVYLQPGKHLSLSYSLKKGEKEMVFGGDLAEENRFLQKHDFYAMTPRMPLEKDMRRIDRNVDSVLQINLQKLQEASFSKEFKEMEGRRLTASALLSLTRVSFVDDETYRRVLRERFVEDSVYLKVPEYVEFLDQYLIRKLPRIWTPADTALDDLERKVLCITEHAKDPAVVSFLIDKVLFSSAELGEQKYRDLYRRYVKDEGRLAAFAAACKKGDRIMPGNPCPDFTFKDLEGKDVSLSDLKGKYVYIDLWATWCGPCKGEMPSLALLEKKFEGQDLTFVSISVDRNKDIELWKKTVADMKLGGVQLHLGENWDWIKNFMPAGLSVPRFILLDKEGKIVDANMTRPSDKATAERIAVLLKA